MKSRHLVTVCCMLLAGGCADLAAVRDISTRLTAASRGWDEVSDEFARSCMRLQSLNAAVADCRNDTEAAERLQAADAVLNAYFNALGAAATEANFTVKPGIDRLSASAAKIPELDTAQVQAVTGLGSWMARLAGERLREDTLRELITTGGPDAQRVVEGLRQKVAPRLRSQLGAERSKVSGYFETSIQSQGDAMGDPPEAVCSGSRASSFKPLGFLLTQEYCKRIATIAAREKALGDYEATLSAASKALVELQSSSTRLKATEVARNLYGIGQELDASLGDMRKAF